MRYAILVRRLRRRHLVVALEVHLRAGDGEDRIGAPLLLVRRATARLGAAAPLVGEEDLRAVVVERGRMPEGEVGIGHCADALGIPHVADVQQKSVTRAGSASEADGRE